jgi:hypothetical protein
MKPGVMAVAGFMAGVILAAAVLMAWSSREQVRLELELTNLQQRLSEAEQAGRRERETLRNLREELSGMRERSPVVAPTPAGLVAPAARVPAGSASGGAAPAGNNDAIARYLGEPVLPPANLDPKYAPEGLMAAFKGFCEARGVTVEKLGVDTSEYPFLLYGVVRNGSEFFQQISTELKATPGYAYSGSTTSRSKDGTVTFALNMIPSKAYEGEQAEGIRRRNMIRLQMLQAAWEPMK